MVVRQSQVQIIKAITELIAYEWKTQGTQPEFLQFLSEEGMLVDFFQILQNFSGKPQQYIKNQQNLPIELLELSLTQIRINSLENQVSLMAQRQTRAYFSQTDNSLTVFDMADGTQLKKSSFLLNLKITSSINEDSMVPKQKTITHSLTQFNDVKERKEMLNLGFFDILTVLSEEFVPEGSDNVNPLLIPSLQNSSIIITDDSKSPEQIYLALGKLEKSIPQQYKLEPLNYKTVYLVSRETMEKLIIREAKESVMHESKQALYNQFFSDLKSWGQYKEEQLAQIQKKQLSKIPSVLEVQKIRDSAITSSVQVEEVKSALSSSEKYEDLGKVIWDEVLADSKTDVDDLINENVNNLNQVEQLKNSHESEQKNAFAKILKAGTDNANNILTNKYVLTLNQLARLSSRTALITFLQYLNPLPKEILNRFVSLEKLILISFNEALNIKNLTGSKVCIDQVMNLINKLTQDQSMKEFVNDFLINHVMKSSILVIKKQTTDKNFLMREKFDDETNAGQYPLPYFVYKLAKSLLEVSPKVFVQTRGLLSNFVSLLLGLGISRSYVDTSTANAQIKYFGLAAKLLTTVRASLVKGEEEWTEHAKDIAENGLFTKITYTMSYLPFAGIKTKEHMRIMKEVFYEWHEIKRVYELTSGIVSTITPNKYQVKLQKKVEYVKNRDPLTLFQLQSGGDSYCKGTYSDVRDQLQIKKCATFNSLPNGLITPFIMKLSRLPDTEAIAVKDWVKSASYEDIDNFTFYTDKECTQQFDMLEKNNPLFGQNLYLRYQRTFAKRLVFFGTQQKKRLPVVSSTAEQKPQVQKTLLTMLTKVESCGDITAMLSTGGIFLHCGTAKGNTTEDDIDVKDRKQIVKLFSVGKMSVTVVLENNKVEMWGYSKNLHFVSTQPNEGKWSIVNKSEEYDEESDSIVDICTGTHFTLFATKLGRLFCAGMSFQKEVNFEPSTTEIFQRIRISTPEKEEDLQVKRVWCSRAKITILAIIEVFDTKSGETYLMSAGSSFDGLLGQGQDDMVQSKVFKKLDYDHQNIKFAKVSLLTRTVLAITENGELYGWGTNDEVRLGLDASVKIVHKPTMIPYFNNPQQFKVLDVAAGTTHSFVHVQEFNRYGVSMLRTYQLGYDATETSITHRGVTKEQLLLNNGIAPITMLDNSSVRAFACGHTTSLIQMGPERLQINAALDSKDLQPMPWTEINIKNECLPGVLSKRGYLHLVNDMKSESRVMTFDELATSESNYHTFERSEQQWRLGEELKSEQGPQLKRQDSQYKVLLAKQQEEGGSDPVLNKGWFFYSQSEIKNQQLSFPPMSLALRHSIEALPEKLDYFKQVLDQASAGLTIEGESSLSETYKTVTCSQTGQDIQGAFYYASYLEKGVIKEVFLSEEAFAEPSEFDIMPLVYFRFAQPLKTEQKFPAPVDLNKLYTRVGDQLKRTLTFVVKAMPLFYNNRKVVSDLFAASDNSQDNFKKVFGVLLKGGSKYDKQVQQFFLDNNTLASLEKADDFLLQKKKEITKYFKGEKQEFNDSQKALLNVLQKFMNENNYSDIQPLFTEMEQFLYIANRLYMGLSHRNVMKCHPESLPFVKRKMLQQFPGYMRNNIIKTMIEKLPTGEKIDLTVRRRKALDFADNGGCDHEGVHTIFGQVIQEIKKNMSKNIQCFRINSVDKQIMKVNFKGEGSIDAGGPYRDTLTNICKELQSGVLPLLIPTPNNKNNHGQNRECWIANPSAKSPTHLEMFRYLGYFLGMAIRSQQALPLDLAPIFWKLLIDETGDVQTMKENEYDLKLFDTFSWQIIQDLRMNTRDLSSQDFEFGIDERFVTLLSSGEQVQLVNGGLNKKVTKENLSEYIRAVVKTRLQESSVQMKAIKEGVNYVIPLNICKILTPGMIEIRATGSKNLDLDKLKQITHYQGYSSTDEPIQIFWRVMESYSPEERSMYLKFVWGRARLPSTTTQKHVITQLQYNANSCMPIAHTCFFTLDLPRYPSFDIARAKILYAIQYCGDIDADRSSGSIESDD